MISLRNNFQITCGFGYQIAHASRDTFLLNYISTSHSNLTYIYKPHKADFCEHSCWVVLLSFSLLSGANPRHTQSHLTPQIRESASSCFSGAFPPFSRMNFLHRKYSCWRNKKKVNTFPVVYCMYMYVRVCIGILCPGYKGYALHNSTQKQVRGTHMDPIRVLFDCLYSHAGYHQHNTGPAFSIIIKHKPIFMFLGIDFWAT